MTKHRGWSSRNTRIFTTSCKTHNHLEYSLTPPFFCTVASHAWILIPLQEQRTWEFFWVFEINALLPELTVSDNAWHYFPAPSLHSPVTMCMLWFHSTSLSCKNAAFVCTRGLPLWWTWCPPWHFTVGNGFPELPHSNERSKTFLVLMDHLFRVGFTENILYFIHCSFPQTGRKIILTENDVFLSAS